MTKVLYNCTILKYFRLVVTFHLKNNPNQNLPQNLHKKFNSKLRHLLVINQTLIHQIIQTTKINQYQAAIKINYKNT